MDRPPPPHGQDGRLSLVGVSAVVIFWVLLTFWFIQRFAVNTILYDNWADIRLIGRANAGALSFGDLWLQHGENRILLPNLIVLALAHTVRFNIADEDLLSGVLLVVTATLFVLAHRRRSPSTPWLYYVPVVVTVLSLNQGTMDLFGFALSWYLEICALSISLFLLDRQKLSWPAVVGAAFAAICGSFSSLEGLLIWPVGLLLLYHRDRPRPVIVAWMGAAAASFVAYFYRFDFGVAGSGSYTLHHPLEAVRFFFFAIGNVLGITIPNSPTLLDYGVLAFGVVVFMVACWVLVVGLPRPAEQSGASIGVAMVLFGLLYTITLTIGRTESGLVALPRYAVFDLILLAGCYLALVDGTLWSSSRQRDGIQGGRAAKLRFLNGWPARQPAVASTHGRATPNLLIFVLVVAILIQVGIGTFGAFEAADSWHAHELASADIIANIGTAPDGLVQQNLGSSFESSEFIRKATVVAKVNRLSLFGTDLATQLEQRGLTVERTAPTSRIIHPTYGSLVSGAVFLDALASEPYGIRRVQFILAPENGGPSIVIGAGSAYFGWLLHWNSASVPNGHYLLRSKAFDTIGHSSTSAGVLITVEN